MRIEKVFALFVIMLFVFPCVASSSTTVENGFSGEYSVTYNDVNLSTLQNLSFSGEFNDVVISITGAADGVAMDENNSSTYPLDENMLWGSEFNGNSKAIKGNDGIDTNVEYINNSVIFNGSGYINCGNVISHNTSELFIFAVIDNFSSSSNNGLFNQYNTVNLGRSIRAQFTSAGSMGIQLSSTGNDYEINTSYFDSITDRALIILKYNNSNFNLNINDDTDIVSYSISSIYGSLTDFYIGSYQEDTGLGTYSMDKFFVYNTTALDTKDINILLYGVSGIAAKANNDVIYTPITDETISLGNGTYNGIEVVDTAGGTYDITVTRYFTEDTTLDDEYSNGNWYSNVTFTPAQNITNGTITHTASVPNGMYRHIDSDTFALDTNNTNATYTIDGDTITITTGELPEGETTYYYMSAELTTDETVMVTIMNVPLSIYILIVISGLITAAYSVLRKDEEYYTHIISALFSFFLFGTASYLSFSGISGEGWSTGEAMPIMTLYTIDSLGYLFMALTVVMLGYMLMKIYDIYDTQIKGDWMRQ